MVLISQEAEEKLCIYSELNDLDKKNFMLANIYLYKKITLLFYR